jgi:hypothetical protein
VVRCPVVEYVEGGWRLRAVFGPVLRAEHEDDSVRDAPKRMRETAWVALGGGSLGVAAIVNRGGRHARVGPDGEKQRAWWTRGLEVEGADVLAGARRGNQVK